MREGLLTRLQDLRNSPIVWGHTENDVARWKEEIYILEMLKELGAHTENCLDIDDQIKERRDLIRTIERE